MAETDDNARGASFSTKEMLIRLDGKIDAVLARQQGFDVELALVKARADQLAQDQRDHVAADDKVHDEQRKDIVQLERRQERTDRRLAYQAGAVAAVVLLANIAVPLWHAAAH